ncbi:CPBP family glutamic-type intramembrane protease [Cognaticolwellia beringensis]|uniref:CPBP family glutamic-type intramembrane protease n=1 Tax=Cognaticolwellia beringensis TaxID=1967665 RepID=UPI0012F9B321|nr:CPBP family glutamic-type intramembrane protease [Cognaticolwellia beringensis]
MFNLLENTNQSLLLYIFKVHILNICIGLPIAFFLGFYFPNAELPDFELGFESFIGLVLVAPILETFFMIPIIYLFRKITPNKFYVSILSAVFWGGVHSLQVPLWGVGVFSLFFFMSMAYQYWDTHSRGHALFVVMMIHVLNNATVFLLVLF